MIGKEGQYYLLLNFGDERDSMLENDFLSFVYIEEAGNVLPMFELFFQTGGYSEAILRSLNEGSVLKATIGESFKREGNRNQPDPISAELVMSKLESLRSASGQRVIMLRGFLNVLGYLEESRIRIFPKSNPSDVVSSVVSGFFESDIDDFDGIQNWVQYSITDKKFVNELWMHSDAGESSPVVGITSEGVFKMKNLAELAGKEPRWIFGGSKGKNALKYLGDYTVSNSSGVMNTWYGYEREKLVNFLETGQSDNSSVSSPPPELALSDSRIVSGDLGRRRDSVGYLTDNHHDKFFSSNQKNLQILTTTSTYKVKLTVPDLFFDVGVLDTVFFRDTNVSDNSKADDNFTGKYLVSKVSRTISKGSINSYLEIVRESSNNPLGTFKNAS